MKKKKMETENRIKKKRWVSSHDMFKVPFDVLKAFSIVEKIYKLPGRSKTESAPLELFIEKDWCKASTKAPMIERLACHLWYSDASNNPNSKYDAIGKNFCREGSPFEVRGYTAGSFFGPSTSTGAGREPKVSDSREKWLEHHNKIMEKINSIREIIFCDCDFPPFLFLFLVPTTVILEMFDNGSIRYPESTKNNSGLIINTISRNQIYRGFFGTDNDNPNYLDGWKTVNINELDPERIAENIKLVQRDVSNSSLKESSKKVIDKGLDESIGLMGMEMQYIYK